MSRNRCLAPGCDVETGLHARCIEHRAGPGCPECGQMYPPKGGGHCRGGAYGGCCRTFTSNSAFADHKHGTRRTCLDVTAEDGWRETPRGWTNAAPMPLTALAQRRAAVAS